MTKEKVCRGKVLLAEPFMLDPNFKRSVVLVCEHENDATLGFILNKSFDMKINSLIEDFPEIDANVYYGGPVQTDTIHYLHNLGDLLEGSQKVSRDVYWGGDFDQLKTLISSNMVSPGDIRFFVGYSAWTNGQLTDEMKYGSWVLNDMHANYIFKDNPTILWQNAMKNKGNAYSVIAQMPEVTSFN